jgi:hypothetical protein
MVYKHNQNNTGRGFILFASSAAFITYFCMYAFRKPFTAATYNGIILWGLDYKILLIIAQVLGYMLSKFLGIRIVSSMPHTKRIPYLLVFIGCAEISLLGFALVPYQYGWIFLFLNGIPLGMIWGIVFSYLEGRKVTELLAAVLSASFIVSSGIVKSTGKWMLLEMHVSEMWMPFLTGLIYVPLLLTGAWMLNRIPEPGVEEKNVRHEREPINRQERKNLFKQLIASILLLLIVYLYLSAYRDFRDNFAADMWIELGYKNSSRVLALTEIPVALTVLVALAFLYRIRNNYVAVQINHLLIAAGIAIIWISTWLIRYANLSPAIWVVLSGTGVYLAYVPFGSMLFERVVATLKQKVMQGFSFISRIQRDTWEAFLFC